MIHIVGDSHAGSLHYHLPRAILHSVGDKTAYQLPKHEVEIIAECMKSHYYDRIILSFGEIDCRVHLFDNKNIEEGVERYMSVVDKIDRRIILLAPVPTNHETIRGPYSGNREERNNIAREFTRLIKTHRYPVIDLYEVLIDRPDFYEDDIHMGPNAPVLDKIKEAI